MKKLTAILKITALTIAVLILGGGAMTVSENM